MSDSNNVVSFPQRKILKEAEAAIDEIAAFRHFYDENIDGIQLIVDELIYALIEDFGYDPRNMKSQDYALLMESTIAILMRERGINHPLCHEFADSLFQDLPK